MSTHSADIIRKFLHTHKVTITEFAKVTQLSRWSVYKYLDGKPIHPKAAKKIEQNVLEKYRIFIPCEELLK